MARRSANWDEPRAADATTGTALALDVTMAYMPLISAVSLATGVSFGGSSGDYCVDRGGDATVTT